MNFTDFNNFIILKIFLFNYMITKTYAHDIEHQPNIRMIIWNHINLRKQRQITKSNSKLTKY